MPHPDPTPLERARNCLVACEDTLKRLLPHAKLWREDDALELIAAQRKGIADALDHLPHD